MEKLSQLLSDRGYTFTPTWDGQLYKDEPKWIICTESEGVYCAHFGDWSTGEKHEFQHYDTAPDQALPIIEKIAETHAASEAAFREYFAATLTTTPASEPTKIYIKYLSDLKHALALEPLEWKTVKKGKGTIQVPPTENDVAEALLGVYEDFFCREKENIFLRLDTHWSELDKSDIKSFIRNAGQKLMGGMATDKNLNAYFNIFMDKIPSLPPNQSFYIQNNMLCNFLDGTLEIQKHGKEYKKVFREHRREDLLTWVLPYDYKAPRPRNEIFDRWLENSFEGDADKEGKIRAMKQVGGACLISAFPRIVFFQGEGGSGKSTFAKLCYNFVGEGNASSVAPSNMRQDSFLMQTLINKKVNIVLDINKDKRVDEAVFKLVEDGMPIQINRKGVKAVMARIPALHIFGGNELPPGIDGASRAMDRRVTIIQMNKVIASHSSDYSLEYEKEILGGGTGAILDFFEQGLDDLLSSCGKYTNPLSGVKKLQEWKTENDPIGEFLAAIKDGEIPALQCVKEGKIRKMLLWEEFIKLGYGNLKIGRTSFYKLVNQAGYLTKSIEGYDYFVGIASTASEMRLEFTR